MYKVFQLEKLFFSRKKSSENRQFFRGESRQDHLSFWTASWIRYCKTPHPENVGSATPHEWVNLFTLLFFAHCAWIFMYSHILQQIMTPNLSLTEFLPSQRLPICYHNALPHTPLPRAGCRRNSAYLFQLSTSSVLLNLYSLLQEHHVWCGFSAQSSILAVQAEIFHGQFSTLAIETRRFESN